jgi:tRNA(Arg) A34 adenosine deaminase TadA
VSDTNHSVNGHAREQLLRRAFDLAAEARSEGDHPFGALLVVHGEVVAEAKNRVNTDSDITAHAESMLVRNLEREGRLHLLAEGVFYASCEPCPMCVGAMFWAGVRNTVYGLSAARLTELDTAPGQEPFGFTITAPELGAAASPPMTFVGPCLEDEAAAPHHGFWFR